MKNQRTHQKGFSLLELMVVVAVIGILMLLLFPRAQSAKVAAQYAQIRQQAATVGSWGMEWANRSLEAQEPLDTCQLNDYMASLEGYTGGLTDTGADNNWAGSPVGLNGSGQCRNPGSNNPLTATVASLMPVNQRPKNPFSGSAYLTADNDGSGSTSGLLYLARFTDAAGYDNYALLFTGQAAASSTAWHGGMNHTTLDGLRNGVFVARLKN